MRAYASTDNRREHGCVPTRVLNLPEIRCISLCTGFSWLTVGQKFDYTAF